MSSLDPSLLRVLSRIEDAVLASRSGAFADEGIAEKDPAGVTIFIPNWNQRPFLPRSVGSALRGVEALKRAGFDGEVIVVDDASRDGSQRFIRTADVLYGAGRMVTAFL